MCEADKREAAEAAAAGLHPRLGERSPLCLLGSFLLEDIFRAHLVTPPSLTVTCKNKIWVSRDGAFTPLEVASEYPVVMYYSRKTLVVLAYLSGSDICLKILVYNVDSLKLRVSIDVSETCAFDRNTVTDDYLYRMRNDGFCEKYCIKEGQNLGEKSLFKGIDYYSATITACPNDNNSLWMYVQENLRWGTIVRACDGVSERLEAPQCMRAMFAGYSIIDNDATIGLSDNNTLIVMPMRVPLRVNTIKLAGVQPYSVITTLPPSRMFLTNAHNDKSAKLWKLHEDNAAITYIGEVPAETDGTASEHTMVAYNTTLAKGIVTTKLTAKAKPLDVSQFKDTRVLQVLCQKL